MQRHGVYTKNKDYFGHWSFSFSYFFPTIISLTRLLHPSGISNEFSNPDQIYVLWSVRKCCRIYNDSYFTKNAIYFFSFNNCQKTKSLCNFIFTLKDDPLFLLRFKGSNKNANIIYQITSQILRTIIEQFILTACFQVSNTPISIMKCFAFSRRNKHVVSVRKLFTSIFLALFRLFCLWLVLRMSNSRADFLRKLLRYRMNRAKMNCVGKAIVVWVNFRWQALVQLKSMQGCLWEKRVESEISCG